MAQVEFDQSQYGRPSYAFKKTPPLVKLLMKMGVKEEKTANKMLLVIAVIAVVLTVIVIKTQFKKAPPLPPIQLGGQTVSESF